MKHIDLLRLLGAVACVTFASCESTWPYGASDTESRRGSGYSLDNPPSSQSRYMPGPGDASASSSASTTPPETATTTPPPDSVQPSTTTPPPTETTLPQPPPPPATTTTAPAAYGSPVPGRKGFVYPPGSEQKPENMVDVRDFTPGQKVRDPRTGKVFLVP